MPVVRTALSWISLFRVPSITLIQPKATIRALRYQPFDAAFDPEELAEARKWHQSFQPSDIPKGATAFSRSSGPGGQHVNKYILGPSLLRPLSLTNLCRIETKATTTWSASTLLSFLPKLLHSRIRTSKYYTARNDSICIQAQTQRSRTANAEENHQKLFDEVERMYMETVPGESRPEKKQKFDAA